MGHKSPSSRRYLERQETAEILATRRAVAAAHREGTAHRTITAIAHPLGGYAWRNDNLNLSRPLYRSGHTHKL